jgi:very-short-patch-repair endonuclease
MVDYYRHDARLIVELDGASHDGRSDEDRRREDYLRRLGFSILRVSNDEVLKELEAVITAILRAAGREPL